MTAPAPQTSPRPAKPIAEGAPLLDVRGLQTWFPIKKGILQRVVGHHKAVDGVSFHIRTGETLGLVGESGCGKTTVGRTILRLQPATGGQVMFGGKDVFAQDAASMRQLRRDMQIIFQDPGGSLNPRMRVGNIVGEPLEVHGMASGDELRERVEALRGRLRLRASPGTGAEVEVTLPLRASMA